MTNAVLTAHRKGQGSVANGSKSLAKSFQAERIVILVRNGGCNSLLEARRPYGGLRRAGGQVDKQRSRHAPTAPAVVYADNWQYSTGTRFQLDRSATMKDAYKGIAMHTVCYKRKNKRMLGPCVTVGQEINFAFFALGQKTRRHHQHPKSCAHIFLTGSSAFGIVLIFHPSHRVLSKSHCPLTIVRSWQPTELQP